MRACYIEFPDLDAATGGITALVNDDSLVKFAVESVTCPDSPWLRAGRAVSVRFALDCTPFTRRESDFVQAAVALGGSYTGS